MSTKQETKPAAGLVAALIQAQRNFKAAVKEALNPHFRSRYVDLAGAWDACREALWDAGLTVVQFTRVTPTGPVLVTRLEHTSGEHREGEYPLTPAKDRDPQAMGSAMTYARRYTLMAMLGLAPEDDDGTAASNGRDEGKAPARSAAAPTSGRSASPPSNQQTADATITPSDAKKLTDAINDVLPEQVEGEERKAMVLEYIEWATGGVRVDRLGKLTTLQASVVLKKAEAGEMPPSGWTPGQRAA